MKKSILVLAMAFIALAANAQKVKEGDVPPAIKASFTRAHPNCKVDKWEKEGNNYEAEFTENKIECSSDFGPNGQVLETESEIVSKMTSINLIDEIRSEGVACRKLIDRWRGSFSIFIFFY